jgi:hypothetical protein
MKTIDRQLRELDEFDARGAGMLSLYLNTDPRSYDESAIDAEVDRMAAVLRDELAPLLRERLDEELEAVRDYLGSVIAPPIGLALFTCSPRHFFRVVRVPEPVTPAAWWAQWPHVAGLCDVAERIGRAEHDLPNCLAF